MKNTPKLSLGAVAIASVALLSACTVTPIPLSNNDIAKRVEADKARMFEGQEPIKGPMSYPEVAARAMKYGLDYKVRMLEQTLAQGMLEVSHFDMMPRVLANAGYMSRKNDQGGYSLSLAPGSSGAITGPSQTLESNRGLANVEFAWNILDFGVSYYRAKIAADQVLVAQERKRKVLQNLLQDTRSAYFRALAAQKLLSRTEVLMQRANIALARARQVEQQGLLPLPQALAYQRALLDSTTLLQLRRQDLELARIELAGLMNLPSGTEFVLVDEEEEALPALSKRIDAMEDLALNLRPELREEDYKKRMTASEVRRSILALLPGIELNVNLQHDSNGLLLHKNWVDSGFRLTSNLFKLASIPPMMRSQDAQRGVDDARRMALAMAVMTQVRVAYARYGLAKDDLSTSIDSANVDIRLSNYSKAAATSRVDSELEMIRTEAKALLSSYQKHIAYANAQNAWGRLYNTLGFDLEVKNPGAPVGEVAAEIGASLSAWQNKASKME